MTESAALLTVVLPVVASVLGLLMGGRSRPWAGDWAVLGATGALVAAVVEVAGVFRDGPVGSIGLLGRAELGSLTIDLTLRSDQLSAVVAVMVALVALCVQVYSTAYLAGDGTPEAPTRYPGYAATVSLFTAAMMLVIHSGDLVLLLIGWEVMGLASYLLIGHHSERDSARRAAVKAFLVTRVGDLGVLLAVVVLIAGAGTTSILQINRAATAGEIGHGTLLAAGLLLLAGVLGKSAQFPLHTWLPDAMEGPTPVSALIHAATMVVAGVFLVVRFLPLYLQVPGVLQLAAVIAAIGMLGAALAALAQDDLKRLLAYSTISQVAYMLAGVSMTLPGSDPANLGAAGVFHLLSHAGFKALLFLAAGCIIHLAGSTLMADMGGLLRTHRSLAVLFGLGLAALAGIPPLSGFWSKEAVLTTADEAARAGNWAGWVVLLAGLATALITGLYAGRAWSVVALGPAPELPAVGDAETEEPHQALEPGEDAVLLAQHVPELSRAWTAPLYVLAVPTVLAGLLMIHPPALLAGIHVDLMTGVTGALLGLAGVGWATSAPALGAKDIAVVIPDDARALLRDGYRIDAVQHALVVRPVMALARAVKFTDRDVIDFYVRGVAVVTHGAGAVLRRAQTGLATAYTAWVVIAAVVVAVAGVTLS